MLSQSATLSLIPRNASAVGPGEISPTESGTVMPMAYAFKTVPALKMCTSSSTSNTDEAVYPGVQKMAKNGTSVQYNWTSLVP
eukprot:2508531-Rhodomonas_salina.2